MQEARRTATGAAGVKKTLEPQGASGSTYDRPKARGGLWPLERVPIVLQCLRGARRRAPRGLIRRSAHPCNCSRYRPRAPRGLPSAWVGLRRFSIFIFFGRLVLGIQLPGLVRPLAERRFVCSYAVLCGSLCRLLARNLLQVNITNHMFTSFSIRK